MAAALALLPTAVPCQTPAGLVAVPPEIAKAIVIVEGDHGSGTGFVVRWHVRFLVVTNAHVVSGNDRIELVAANGDRLRPSELYVAVGHDVFIMAIDETPSFLEVAENVADSAKVGDPVLVAGNALGDAVVAGLPGKVLGIGPEQLEIDCQFVSGNSGSPIVLLSTHEVLGVATYTSERRLPDESLRDKLSPFAEVRRFGYRLDSIRTWQEVDWPTWAREARQLLKMRELSDTLLEIANDMGDGTIDTAYPHEAVATSVEVFRSTQRAGAVDNKDRHRSEAVFLMETMRAAATRDLDEFWRTAQYDFHRRQAERLRPFRERLAAYFAAARDEYRESRR